MTKCGHAFTMALNVTDLYLLTNLYCITLSFIVGVPDFSLNCPTLEYTHNLGQFGTRNTSILSMIFASFSVMIRKHLRDLRMVLSVDIG